MDRTLYLIRHGQPVGGDSPKRCSCPDDTPLDETGRYQAHLLAKWRAEHPLTALFASPLPRALETAQIMAGDALPVTNLEQLREVDCGLWTGITFDEIRTRYPQEYRQRGLHIATAPPPGGESFQAAAVRMHACITQLMAQSTGDVAVVAHGGINRSWLCQIMGRPLDQLLQLRQPWGGISQLSFSAQGGWQVESIGLYPV